MKFFYKISLLFLFKNFIILSIFNFIFWGHCPVYAGNYGRYSQSECSEIFINSSIIKSNTVTQLTGSSRDVYSPVFVEGKTGIKVKGYFNVTSQNIHDLLTHQVDPNDPTIFGFKAVGFSLIKSVPIIIFFPTGSGPKSFNVHHRDALVVAIDQAIDRQIEDLKWFEQVAGDIIKQQSNSPEFQQIAENTVKLFRLSLDRSLDFTNLTVPNDYRSLIKTRAWQKDAGDLYTILSRAQGYQFQGKKIKGQWKIINVDIDSSLTSYQKNQLRIPISKKYNFKLLDFLYNNIDPELRAFNGIKMPNGMKWMESYPIFNDVKNGISYYTLPSGAVISEPD